MAEKLPAQSKGRASRDSNIELLRIVSMLLIVTYHFSMCGFYISESEPVTFNVLFLNFIGFGGRLGVDLFIIISGYFMVEQSFRARKAVRLWLRCVALTGVFAVVYFVRGEVSVKDLVMVLISPVNNTYWFVTKYFMILIFSDYINIFVHTAGKKKVEAVTALLALVCTVLPTCCGIRMDSSTFVFFVFMYLVGAYIRVYKPRFADMKQMLVLGVALHLLCNAASCALLANRARAAIFGQVAYRMSEMNDMFIVMAAVMIFCGFKNLKMGYSKAVNVVAASTFGVYLIHVNGFTQNLLWVRILKSPGYLYSSRLVPFAVGAIALEYAVCTAIDMAYLYGVEKWLVELVCRCGVGIKGLCLRVWDKTVKR